MKWPSRILRYPFVFLFAALSPDLSSQLIVGTTGLFTVPSAGMQPDKTLRAGVNCLSREATPDIFGYTTWNYYLDLTILPCLEVAYTCTLFRGDDTFLPEKKGRFVNQDRAFSFRFRVWKEGRYLPAVVFGWNDMNLNDLKRKQVSPGKNSNRFFSGLYLAATKHVRLKSGEFGFHGSYTYTNRVDARVERFSFGAEYTPAICREGRIIVEATEREANIGVSFYLFRHLFLYAFLEKGRYASGGIGYCVGL